MLSDRDQARLAVLHAIEQQEARLLEHMRRIGPAACRELNDWLYRGGSCRLPDAGRVVTALAQHALARLMIVAFADLSPGDCGADGDEHAEDRIGPDGHEPQDAP